MDAYSIILYHLKEDMKLSYVAQELISIDRLSPQAWCAMDNCYILQRDHEMALKNFQRAIQFDSRFAYAHTLCVHEHIALEYHDNGIKCFHNALQRDDEALVLIDKAIIADKKNLLPMYEKANVFVSLERYEDALKVLKQLIEFSSRDSSDYALMGRI
ncbi:hypothetical protein KSP39_PZI010667 [Platanthera zijinensis]|uniref:Tetratricopeptide repeat protein n=1 Tax=Platanthera zijinensis TaxID=2320716 RepID=A0AAP0BHR0_9ASPA